MGFKLIYFTQAVRIETRRHFVILNLCLWNWSKNHKTDIGAISALN